MRLLPKKVGWVPFAWLIYLGFFFLQPILGHASRQEWIATVAVTAVFLVLYFLGYWVTGWRRLGVMGGMVALGVVVSPFNGGASVFFVYGGALAGWFRKAYIGYGLLGAILVIIGLESWVLHLPVEFWAPAAVFTLLIGSVNIHYGQRDQANAKLRLAHDEIEHLAKVAERERIARDLHDVLGHTLSVVVLKSELASRVIDSDPQRAGREMREVEQIAREALMEVRNTIRGYRANSLQEELQRAHDALETAGVDLHQEVGSVALAAPQEGVLVMLLREAITNVVRHARARNCWVNIAQSDGHCQLEVRDDGWGGKSSEGNGLRGMRERVEALNGSFDRKTGEGTRICISFPTASPEFTR